MWTGVPSSDTLNIKKTEFEVAELQQMTDPILFIEKTIDQYKDLNIEMVREAFEEVKAEMRRIEEEKGKGKAKK
jgi:exonuclease SbcD